MVSQPSGAFAESNFQYDFFLNVNYVHHLIFLYKAYHGCWRTVLSWLSNTKRATLKSSTFSPTQFSFIWIYDSPSHAQILNIFFLFF